MHNEGNEATLETNFNDLRTYLAERTGRATTRAKDSQRTSAHLSEIREVVG